jgi:hypothetical protein
MASMAEYKQTKGVVMGFYSDSYRYHGKTCQHAMTKMRISVAWDGIKVGSCGAQRNMARCVLESIMVCIRGQSVAYGRLQERACNSKL